MNYSAYCLCLTENFQNSVHVLLLQSDYQCNSCYKFESLKNLGDNLLKQLISSQGVCVRIVRSIIEFEKERVKGFPTCGRGQVLVFQVAWRNGSLLYGRYSCCHECPVPQHHPFPSQHATPAGHTTPQIILSLLLWTNSAREKQFLSLGYSLIIEG